MTPDLILVGGGLASGLLAYRLRHTRPDLSLLVLERDATIGGVHTWSFHATDLTAAQNDWIAPFVTHAWPGYEVRFPGLRRELNLPYRAISSARFAQVLADTLGPSLRTGVVVQDLTPTSVTLASGEIIHAGAVIDASGFRPDARMVDRFQSFLGQEVRLRAPHAIRRPILMDATIPQLDAYRFIYVLPFAPDTMLIEDTYYTEDPHLDPPTLRARIAAYAAGQGWEIAEILREESGVLPITLSADMNGVWRSRARQVAAVGMRAGLYHPTTGYSLPDAVRLADRIAALPRLSPSTLSALTCAYARAQWRRGNLFRLLNRLLFLSGPAQDRYKVMRRFYGMSEPLIARFYAGQLLFRDKARLLIGRPPVPFLGAVKAMTATGK